MAATGAAVVQLQPGEGLPLSLKDGRKAWVPDYTSHLPTETWLEVYEPAEDSWLFLDAFFGEQEFLRQRFGALRDSDHPVSCLEIGVGSGILSAHVHWTLTTQLQLPAFMRATDINPRAATAARSVFQRNQVDGEVLVCDLVGELLPTLRHKVDLLIFNPPYVPTNPEEVGSSGIEASWAGGIRGREVIDRLLPLIPELLSPAGACYMILVRPNQPEEVAALLRRFSEKAAAGDESQLGALAWEVVLERRRMNEQLSVNRFARESAEQAQDDGSESAAAAIQDPQPIADVGGRESLA